MANYSVVNNPNGGWDIKKDSADRASAHTDTQKQAESLAKGFAGRSGGGEVRTQGRNGQFRDSDTVPPGHDPNPPRDTRH